MRTYGVPSTATWAVALLLLTGGASAAEEAAFEDEPLALPMTIQGVWFDPPREMARGRKKGDLTITEDGIEFRTSNKTWDLPLNRIRLLSFGKMRGDVDTDWAVLEFGESGAVRLIGFRDGSKLGFGERTPEIYGILRSALRQFEAAQYDAAEGYRTYDDFDRQYTLAIPTGWKAWVVSVVGVGDRVSWGRILFYDVAAARRDAVREGPVLWDAVAAGKVPSILFDRREAERGTTCHAIPDKQRDRLRDEIQAGEGTRSPVTVEPYVLDGCNGYRFRGEVSSQGVDSVLEVYAAARHGTLFLVGHRSPHGSSTGSPDPLDTLLSTLRFSVALPGRD